MKRYEAEKIRTCQYSNFILLAELQHTARLGQESDKTELDLVRRQLDVVLCQCFDGSFPGVSIVFPNDGHA